MIPAAITEVSGRWKASEAAIAFGFGDIKFPALPPPIIASKIAGFDKLPRFANANAIGETVITATSTNTPTAVKIIVESTKASNARVSPNFFTMVSAMVLAAPDSINTPANTPAAKIRITAVVIPCAPPIIKLTVCDRSAPPIKPPTNAPINIPYAGGTFFKIRTIATERATTAPIAVTVTIISPYKRDEPTNGAYYLNFIGKVVIKNDKKQTKYLQIFR